MYPKILIGIPTYDGKIYCQDDFIESIFRLTYPHQLNDIVFVDNSPTKDNYRKLCEYGFTVIYQDPAGKSDLQRMADANEELRQYTLRHGYSYLFNIEPDIFPMDKSIIEKLRIHRLPIVSGIYYTGEGTYRQLSCTLSDTSETNEAVKFTPVNIKNEMEFINGDLQAVFNGSLGCTLMNQSFLENIKFRFEKDKIGYPDFYLAVDTFNSGTQWMVDTSLLCRHRNTSWFLKKNKEKI